MRYNRIVKTERDTQNRAIDLVLDTLHQYRYLGNLEEQENNNIREEDLCKFLTSRQGCNEASAADAIRQLKDAAACSTYQALYEKGLKTYQLLRNGANVSQGHGMPNRHVDFIDWQNPLNNDFAIAEEVTVRRVTEDLKHRRPDIVVYVNGIAVVVLELKKMSVSVADAIRQNRRNQKNGEICQFFTTVQLLMAGNESEGIKYGVTKTPEEYWLTWKEPTGSPCEPSRFTQQVYRNEMMRSLLQMLEPSRLLEFMHDCIIYDGGIKKAARPNQYFALAAAKKRVRAKESGIIWHSQGAGKSLTMVWLAQWIKEQGGDRRIVIMTDRDELDKQIMNGFKATGETPYRATSGADLINALNTAGASIICTLIHKFGVGLHDDQGDKITVGDKKASRSPEECMEQIAASLPEGFKLKGDVVVFVDECHRTQGGILHKAMKRIMGEDVMMVGFTGTPLLNAKKTTTLEQFGSYIHTYKFDEAVRDGVIRDLRYEARSVEQMMTDDDKASIDKIFEAKTIGMTPRAKEALKTKWATLQNVYSSNARICKIVANICVDMVFLDPLKQGYGNAMLVAGSIYQAYKFWDAFEGTYLKGKTAVVSSYDPQTGVGIDSGHSTDADNDEETFKYYTAKRMMGDRNAIDFEEWAKYEFIHHPGTMKLLIVVDKLLTGFDAPSATYLYIDKHMEDHNLFQAICRVNRNNGILKEYGYIVDYKDLFNEIAGAVEDYTNGAFANFDHEDVKGLLKNRLEQGKKDLDEALEKLDGICQHVKHPKSLDDFFDYFVFDQATTLPEEQQGASLENANKREMFYNAVITLTNRYLAIATQMTEAGYSVDEAKAIHAKVNDYEKLRQSIMLRSGDTTDLKQYNAMMRQLLDQYVQAPKSDVLGKLDDFSFLDIIDIKSDDELVDKIIDDEKTIGGQPAAAETIAANTRKYIVRKRDANPDFYDRLSEKLNKILEQLQNDTEAYKKTLKELIALVREMKGSQTDYPPEANTEGKKALFDNLGKSKEMMQTVYDIIVCNAQQGFRDDGRVGNTKRKKLKNALSSIGLAEDKVEIVMGIAMNNQEF